MGLQEVKNFIVNFLTLSGFSEKLFALNLDIEVDENFCIRMFSFDHEVLLHH